MSLILREIGAALAVFVLIFAGFWMVWRERRAERKRQERLAVGVDVERERQRNMRIGRT